MEEAVTLISLPEGRWAIQTVARGLYVGGNGEGVAAFTRKIDPDRIWTLHLAIHPQYVTIHFVISSLTSTISIQSLDCITLLHDL